MFFHLRGLRQRAREVFTLSVKADIRKVAKALDDMARKQLPFATAQAINATAEKVRLAQRDNMREVLDEPTPFTLNSVAIKRATKSKPTALVYVKPVAAAYLLPYEIGGKNKLNSKALLKPINAKVNQYGNLPRNLVKRLASKPNTFIGKVKTKRGLIDGVWQRTKKTRGKAGGLKLLVEFTDAHEARQRLDYRGVGKRVVAATFRIELDRAVAKALATAR
ncbi:hypothetical protein [Paraburkholderia sp. PGU19]|uniref:hypothetical protein n=1 Tax=Paraburkholderia sp. PGU19 TaxID=2735434 RepID=UPI001FB0AC62|nr:hypothetical protein [Paraburkholderia sp. PGU19]